KAFALGQAFKGTRQVGLDPLRREYWRRWDDRSLSTRPRPRLPHPVEIAHRIIHRAHLFPVLPSIGERLGRGLATPFGAVGRNEGATKTGFRVNKERRVLLVDRLGHRASCAHFNRASSTQSVW